MKNFVRSACFTAVILLAASGAHAATACPGHFLNAVPPDVTNPKMAAGAIELCSSGFATLFSPLSLDPIYSAEYLTADRIRTAKERGRTDSFHSDDRLPAEYRTTLSEWKAVGVCLDRGHMANDKDMASQSDEYESFVLSNMVPQDTDNNEHLWEGIESAVRDLTLRNGAVYVLTGPIFRGNLQRLNGRMLVPTQLFKAFYVPSTGETGVYVTNNAAGDKYWSISLSQLRDLAGVDAFPSLSQQVKDTPMSVLPVPHSHIPHGRNREARGVCSVFQAAEAGPEGQAAAEPRVSHSWSVTEMLKTAISHFTGH
jgi:endonuclease G